MIRRRFLTLLAAAPVAGAAVVEPLSDAERMARDEMLFRSDPAFLRVASPSLTQSSWLMVPADRLEIPKGWEFMSQEIVILPDLPMRTRAVWVRSYAPAAAIWIEQQYFRRNTNPVWVARFWRPASEADATKLAAWSAKTNEA